MTKRKNLQFPGPEGVRYVPVIGARIIGGTGKRQAGEGDENVEVEVSFSSEFEVERNIWGFTWREVLDHSPGSVQLSRFTSGRAAVLMDHDMKRQAGVIRSARVDDDKVGRAVVRLSRTQIGRDLALDLEDEIKGNISVGYVVKKAQLVEVDDERGELWRITSWEPLELSFVSVPADPTVGVGRSSGTMVVPPVEIEDLTTMKRTRKQIRQDEDEDEDQHQEDDEDQHQEDEDEDRQDEEDVDENQAGDEPDEDDEGERAMKGRKTRRVTVGDDGNRRNTKTRDAEVAEILEFAEANHVPTENVRDWIGRGLTPDQAARALIDLKRTDGTMQPPAEVMEGMSKKDRSRYSYRRAILLGADMRAEDKDPDGIEGEVHQELVKRRPSAWGDRGGIMVPMRTHTNGAWGTGRLQRTLDSKTAGKGSEIVFDQPGDFIEILRNQTFTLELGARLLTGLTAPITFPKQQGAMTVYWVGENPGSDTAESDVDLGLAHLVPKTMIGAGSFARQLLATGTIDTETMVREDLAAQHSLALDKAGAHGKGADGEPTGIYLAPDVQALAMGGNPTFGKLVDMLGKVADQNALRGGIGWVTTPLMAAFLMQTLEASAAGAKFIWTGPMDNGMIAGYKAVATNQISKTMSGSAETGGSEHGIIAGNWPEMIVGVWEGFEMIVDPFAKKKQGLIEVATFQMGDVMLRHGQSFVKSTGATRPAV